MYVYCAYAVCLMYILTLITLSDGPLQVQQSAVCQLFDFWMVQFECNELGMSICSPWCHHPQALITYFLQSCNGYYGFYISLKWVLDRDEEWTDLAAKAGELVYVDFVFPILLLVTPRVYAHYIEVVIANLVYSPRLKQKITLEEVLRHKPALDLFVKHCCRERNEESIMFIYEVMKMKINALNAGIIYVDQLGRRYHFAESALSRHRLAQAVSDVEDIEDIIENLNYLYDRYMHRLNISSAQRTRIRKKMERLNERRTLIVGEQTTYSPTESLIIQIPRESIRLEPRMFNFSSRSRKVSTMTTKATHTAPVQTLPNDSPDDPSPVKDSSDPPTPISEEICTSSGFDTASPVPPSATSPRSPRSAISELTNEDGADDDTEDIQSRNTEEIQSMNTEEIQSTVSMPPSNTLITSLSSIHEMSKEIVDAKWKMDTIEEKNKEKCIQMFDSAMEEVFALIQKDSFPRFKQSRQCKALPLFKERYQSTGADKQGNPTILEIQKSMDKETRKRNFLRCCRCCRYFQWLILWTKSEYQSLSNTNELPLKDTLLLKIFTIICTLWNMPFIETIREAYNQNLNEPVIYNVVRVFANILSRNTRNIRVFWVTEFFMFRSHESIVCLCLFSFLCCNSWVVERHSLS